MQNNKNCFNKIYCSFNEKGKDAAKLLNDSFVDYLRKIENEIKTFEKKEES